MSKIYLFLPFFLCSCCQTQVIKPCQDILKYVKNDQPNQSTAIIALESKHDLDGIFLKIEFDGSTSLSSEFGKFTTTNNKTHTLINPTYELKADTTFPVHIKISGPNPNITAIKLNGRTICKIDTTKTKTVEKDEMIYCGRGKVPKTLGTGDVEKGYYQWLAAIYVNDKVGFTYRCVGSLINKNYVLITGYCAIHYKKENITVYFGKQYDTDLNSPGLQERKVVSLLLRYNWSTQYNDVTLLELDKPVDFTDYVYPICLWDTDPNEKIYQTGITVGWEIEVTPDYKLKTVLKQFESFIIDKEQCIDSKPDTYINYYKKKVFCGGYTNYTDKQFPCLGSTGTNMIFRKPNSDPEHPIWMLRGIFTVRGDNNCDTENYILFMDIARHLDWIFHAMTDRVAVLQL